MKPLYLLFLTPLLLAFAPVPLIKPMIDPDKAIQQFDRDAGSKSDALIIAGRKRQLVGRLEELHTSLLKRGLISEAEPIRERLELVKSMEGDRPLGSTPKDLLYKASVEGKYRHLLHVLYVPTDRLSYPHFHDFGHWPGSSYMTWTDLRHGHWVYVHPRWYIWRDGPPKP
jgi:hypothetical protein